MGKSVALKMLVATLAIGIASARSYGVKYTWTGNVNANFSNAGNWNPAGGPPGAADSVLFDTPKVPAVLEFDGNRKNQSLTLGSGKVTLKLGLKTYELTGPNSLTLGGTNGTSSPSLSVRNGTLKTRAAMITGTIGPQGEKYAGDVFLGDGRFETWGTMTVGNTPGTKDDLEIGDKGFVSSMFDGGLAASVGEVKDAVGRVFVTNGGEWYCRGDAVLGLDGEGEIVIAGRGRMECQRSLSLGANATGSGRITNDGVADLGRLYVGEKGSGTIIAYAGEVQTRVAWIGVKEGSVGKVLVRGAGGKDALWRSMSIAVGGGDVAGGKGTIDIGPRGSVQAISPAGVGQIRIWPSGIIRGVSSLTGSPIINDGTLEAGEDRGKSGTLKIELVEYVQGNQGAIVCKCSTVNSYTKLVFTGSDVKLTFAGKLVLKNAEQAAFAVPGGGPYEMKIMEWPANATIQGQFATIEKFDVPEGFVWDMSKLYTDGIVKIKAAAVGGNCAADLNGDSIVNEIDLAILVEAMGICEGTCEADLNDDGVVDANDLAILISAWGVCP